MSLKEKESSSSPIIWEDEGSVEEKSNANLSILARIWTTKKFNSYAFMSTMEKVWKPSRGVEANEIADNVFRFQFNHWKDKEKVLEGEPWHFDKSIVVLLETSEVTHPSMAAERLHVTPFWVRIYEPPLKGRNERNVGAIANAIGKFIKCDDIEGNKWGRFIRVRVGMNLCDPFPPFIEVNAKKGGIMKLNLQYEKLPNICYVCGKLGHISKDCEDVDEGDNIKEKGVYGEWMRAPPGGISRGLISQGSKGGGMIPRNLFNKKKTMAENSNLHHHHLRCYELRLLRCSLPSPPSTTTRRLPPPPPPPLHSHIDQLISLIESGRYIDSLSSDLTRSVFQFSESSEPSQFYAELERAVETYLLDGGGDGDVRFMVVVSVAVAAFLAFLQSNFTGPVIELPSCPLPWIEINDEKKWEAWARIQLMSAGSDLAAKFSNLQYIVFSRILLTKTRDLLFSEKAICAAGLETSTWWLARLIILQQHILDDRCASLLDLVQVYLGECLNNYGNVEKVTSYWGAFLEEEEALTIISMLQVEAGLVEYAFGRIEPARQYFEAAASSAGLELSVTGALGFRTVHQVEPKAQMILVANSSFPNDGGSPLVSSSNDQNPVPNHQDIKEASEVLLAPKIVDDGGSIMTGGNMIQDGHTVGKLTAIQQAVVLAQCLLIEKSGRMDELKRWDMAPYIEAIDCQQSSNFTIKSFCNILRVRWEAARSRTKERALLMMDKVVQNLYEQSPQVMERVHSSFAVYTPAVPVLRKEYGELLISHGLIGEALRIFEDFELWDNLIYCYRLLEKKAVAVELIKSRLQETPSDPRLWCSLGDVMIDDSFYEEALKVSNNWSARAKRSLARSAYNRGDYEKSKVLWESALALNSCYPDGWFALGAAALKARDLDKALDAFVRAVGHDPDNGEAWNNIACLHMIRNKSDAAFIAFKQALKFKRNSWQMWENFSQVSADVGNFTQALEASQMVLDLTGNKRFDGELLERIVRVMEKRCSSTASDKDDTDQTVSVSELADSRETQRLMELLGKVLQLVVRNVGSGEIWGLYARWHKIRGDLTMCSEALLKQVRSYQGSEVWKDLARFTQYARASLELCKVYMEISSSTGSLRELHAADMHLRNTVKQAYSFTDTEEFKDLQVCLNDVQMRLKSISESTS